MKAFKRCFRVSKQQRPSDSDDDKRLKRSSDDISTEEEETINKSKRLKLLLPRCKSFGEDISTEILLRLSVKSVVKFKSVSKLWSSIVSSPRFRQTHASLHRASPVALHFKLLETDPYRVLPLNTKIYGSIDTKIANFYVPDKRFSHFSRPRQCRSSCNGLLLLTSYDDTYYVYNPTTKYCKVLDIPQHIRNIKFVCASLAFDPSESLHYRVIFLWPQHDLSEQFQLEVYSSATGECKSPASNTLVGSFDYPENRGIFRNGAIHWLQKDSTSIIYFNVHTECINELQIPPLGVKIIYCGESQGHLHLVKSDHYCFSRSSFLYVFELKNDYSGWFLKYKVELTSITSALPQVNAQEQYETSLSIVSDEEEDDSVLLLWLWDEWVEYNFRKKTTKRLCRYMLPRESSSLYPWTYWFNTYQIIPTLTCI